MNDGKLFVVDHKLLKVWSILSIRPLMGDFRCIQVVVLLLLLFSSVSTMISSSADTTVFDLPRPSLGSPLPPAACRLAGECIPPLPLDEQSNTPKTAV